MTKMIAAKKSSSDAPALSVLNFMCLDRPLLLKAASSMITLHPYAKVDSDAPELFRIQVKDDAMTDLTRTLYKPKTIPDETAKTLHTVNGMLIRLTKASASVAEGRYATDREGRVSTERERVLNIYEAQYVFVGYVDQPAFFIRCHFGEHGIYAISNHEEHTKVSDSDVKAHDYSIPFDPDHSEDASCSDYSEQQQCNLCRARMSAYANNVESFTNRVRGNYFCIFRYNRTIYAADRHQVFSLPIDDPRPSYNKKACMLIYALAGFNLGNLLKGDITSNHTETSFVVACVRDPLSVFATGKTECEVFYVKSSLSADFYLTEYMPRTFKMYERKNLVDEDGRTIDAGVVPYPDNRWFRNFVGHTRYVSRKRRLQAAEIQRRQKEGRHPDQLSSIVVYDGFLNEQIVFCTEHDFVIEMLTLDGDNVFDVRDRLLRFYRDGQIKAGQYTLGWPPEFTDPADLASKLFKNSKLNRLLDLKSVSPTPSGELLKAIIVAIYGGIPVASIREKVKRPLSLGMNVFSYPDGQHGRLNISAKDDSDAIHRVYARPEGQRSDAMNRVYATIAKSRLVKVACTVREDGQKRYLETDGADVSISITTTGERISRFLYAFFKRGEAVNIDEALASTERPESWHPANFATPSGGLLESMILAIEYSIVNSGLRNAVQQFVGDCQQPTVDFAISAFGKYSVAPTTNLVLEMVQHARFHEKGTSRAFLQSLNTRYDTPIDIGRSVLSAIEEYIDRTSRQQRDSAFTAMTKVGFSVRDGGDRLLIDGEICDDAITIPKSFDLNVDYDEVSVVRPIDIFSGELPRVELSPDDVCLLFHEADLDHYAFTQIPTERHLERSTCMMRLYRKLVENPSLCGYATHRPIRPHTRAIGRYAQTDYADPDMFCYTAFYEHVKWAVLTSMP